jgi:hypothetical protein
VKRGGNAALDADRKDVASPGQASMKAIGPMTKMIVMNKNREALPIKKTIGGTRASQCGNDSSPCHRTAVV